MITEEQKAQFLDSLGKGIGEATAAEEIGEQCAALRKNVAESENPGETVRWVMIDAKADGLAKEAERAMKRYWAAPPAR